MKSGYIAISEDRNVFTKDNGVTGVDLCHLGNGHLLRSFDVPSMEADPRARPSTQSAFAKNSDLVVIGGDHGKVWVFDRKQGTIVDTLFHSTNRETMVQTVAVRTPYFHLQVS